MSRYDLATPQELLYHRLLAPSIAGHDISRWKVLADLEATLGTWIEPYVEADKISSTITEAFPVGGQTAVQEVEELVGDCEKILDRDTPGAGPDLNQLVTVDSVTLRNIGDDGAVNAYIRAYVDHERWFRTTTAQGFSFVRWPGISLTKRLIDGQPIFFEVWSDGWAYDTLLGGFVIYPRRDSTQEDDEAVFQTSVNWDWNRRSATSRQGTASVTVRFSTRAENQK